MAYEHFYTTYQPRESVNPQISELEAQIEYLIDLRNSLEADADLEPETLEPWHVPEFSRMHAN